MVSGSQVAAHYQMQASRLSSLIDTHRNLIEQLRATDAALEAELSTARKALAAIYLPALTEAAFAQAARLTGFQGFARRDPRAAMEQERKVLAANLAQIEADERYQRRELLVGSAGTLSQELDMALEGLAPLQAECDRFEQQAGFAELLEIGYDTPAFQEKWWHASYWRHWAAGDRICKALDLADFGDDVIPAYRKYAEPRDVMRGHVQRLEKSIDEVHALVQARDQRIDRLAHLEDIYLGDAQEFLGEHLGHADLALLEQWILPEAELARPVQLALRRLAGLQAKRQIVGDIAQAGVPALIGQLEQRRAKATRKAQKFARPKYAYHAQSSALIDDGFASRADALEAQRDKLQRRVDALVAARNYDGFELTNDPQLWWMYLMRSAPPRFAPALYDYYQRRPGATPTLDPDYVDAGVSPGEAAAAALAAGDLEGGSYLS